MEQWPSTPEQDRAGGVDPSSVAAWARRLVRAIAPSGEEAAGVQRLLLVVSVCFTAFAAGLTLVLLLGDDARPLMLMVLAVVIVTAYGGRWAGLLSVLLSLALSSLLLFDESWAPAGQRLAINLIVLALAAAVVAAVVDGLRNARAIAAERQRLLDEISRSEERLRVAVGALPMFVFNQDRDLRYTWVSTLGPGFSSEQVLGASDEALFPQPDAQRIMAIKRRALDSAQRVREEITVDYGGEMRTFDLTIEPYHANGDVVSGIIGAAFDVTERKRLEEALREANRAKDAFAGHVSHEMRTPLTLIRGNAELLERRSGLLTEHERLAALADIRESTERLDGVIEDLLVLARLNDGQSLQLAPVAIQSILRQSIDEHRRASPRRRIDLTVDGAPPPVHASASALRQVFANLLSNADKYSPAEHPIEVSVREARRQVIVTVRDHGNGFGAADGERLFDEFYRAAETSSVSGHGIGLSVCRRLVEAQGGKIWAQLADGGGAEFLVTLPA